MIKPKQKKELLIVLSLFFLFLIPNVSADLGSSNIGEQLHIWNSGSIATDYYYTGTCNQQLSNQQDEQWETVSYGMTYGSTKEDLLNNYIELQSAGCNLLNSSTEDLVNFTAWKDVSFLGKSGRIAKQSTIDEDDNYMNERFLFKSNDDINQDVWFVIKRTNLDVSYNGNDNFLYYYNLTNNEPNILNLSVDFTAYRNQDEIRKGFFIKDVKTSESITFYTDTGTDFYYIVHNGDIYLVFKAGTFSAGQTKSLPTQWVDARCTCFGSPTQYSLSISFPTGKTYDVGDTFAMQLTPSVDGAICNSCPLTWQDSTGGWSKIPASDTDLDCTGADCYKVDANEQTYSQTLTCEGAGSYSTRGYYQPPGQNVYSTTQTVNCNAPVTVTNFTNVTLKSPLNNSQFEYSELNNTEFIYQVNGTTTLTNCSLIRDSSIVFTNYSITNNSNNSIWFNTGEEGQHNWTINCTMIDSTSAVAKNGEWYYNVYLPTSWLIWFALICLVSFLIFLIYRRKGGES